MSFKVGVIPARMGSSRFPNKPMAEICGMPMIGHVYIRSLMSKKLDVVYVATCDQVIYDYVVKVLGGKAVMTKSTHERATDRTAEAIEIIEKELGIETSLIVLIQGDEPLVTGNMIDVATEEFEKIENATVLNLYSKIDEIDDFNDKNEIKVVLNKNKNRALYFSRSAIPNSAHGLLNEYRYKQVCIMPFRKTFLKMFNELEPTELEIAESIDMLRLLENDINVYMAESPNISYSVDTKSDLEFVANIMSNDELTRTYLEKV